ncbi:PREDICTED: vinculin-like isoform X1 [Priapulus caudatus]|uniref:Vinculin n=1 Tax=Priapulus caudatus TaxID=37621 RepID=A0ABM1DQH3_PRICU|nr:PREDICTED: vinculin-like isoform X1 [Priapulus caudatus]
MTDTLADLRAQGKGTSPQALALAKNIDSSLLKLNQLVQQAISNSEKSGVEQPAHTVFGRVEQAQKWLRNPQYDDRGLGYQATTMVVEEGRKVAQGLAGPERGELLRTCDEVEQLAHQLRDLVRRGQGNSPQAQATARQLGFKLNELKDRIQSALVQQVVGDFADITTPLKQFTDAALAPESKPNRVADFEDKANRLTNYATNASQTAYMVAAAGGCRDKKTVEALNQAARQVSDLTPQLINAGRIRLMYPANKSADEHFEMLRKQYADSLTQMRNLVDIAIDTPAFIKATEDTILRHTAQCEEAVKRNQQPHFVENTSNIARLANRVLMVAKQESDNSEDPSFKETVDGTSDDLNRAIHGMVQGATGLAPNLQNPAAATQWRGANKGLITSVGNVRKAITVYPDEPDISQLSMSGRHAAAAPKPAPPPPPPKPQESGISEQDLDSLLNVDFNAMFDQSDLLEDRPKNRRVNISQRPPQRRTYQEARERMRADSAPAPPLPPPPQHVASRPKQEAPITAGHAQGHQASPQIYHGYGPDYGKEQDQYAPRVIHKDQGYYSQNYPSYASYHEDSAAPPRPPPPGGAFPPPRPPPPETDDEDEMVHFPAPQANQPIMMAAHSLHQEAKQWSSRDNEIIGAAKRMAILMARLSQLVRGEGGSKKDLIACAKAIADASEEVTRLAKELARQCTDKRMRMNLLQVCERIPTIGTQLKILSTVKATMLGAQEMMPLSPDGSEITGDGSEEDQEATEMLVGNAENLMHSVKETVRAAEAASIKIRTDSGCRLRWERKPAWYH